MKNKYFYRYLSFIFALLVSVLIISCANMGMPDGGSKDTTPPKIVESIPENFSKQFNSQRIRITFDEFVVLKSINQALVISPPVDNKPEIQLKGKTLYIEFQDKFQDSTTYSLNFGNSITDNNEGNVLKNFNYVFSTGDVIDSLSISGKLVNSYTGKPEENVIIMAYTNLSDSIPITEIPVYIARSLEDGSFKLNNLKDTVYKIFALSDANSNYLFDQPNEGIAFLDSFIRPFVNIEETIDTLHIDSLDFDSVVTHRYEMYYPDNINLNLFEEKISKQYLKSFSRPEKSKLQIAFNQEIIDSVEIIPVNFAENQFLQDYSSTLDSITLWLTDTLLFTVDTLIVDINYLKTDSLANLFVETKRAKFGYREKSKPSKEKLKLKVYPKNKSKLDLAKQVHLRFSRPIEKIDTSYIDFTIKEDSLFNPVKYSIIEDTIDIKKYIINFDIEENKKYSLSIDDSAFCDYTGVYIDSIGSDFTSRKTKSYGSLIVSLSGIDGNGIIQLLGSRDKIVKELFVNGPSKVTFELLNVGTYRLKYIDDRNGNKEWDTGNYLEKLQPEKIIMHNEEIKVRANWELEINFSPLF